MPKRLAFTLSKREIARRIYLSGIGGQGGYTVRVSRLDGLQDIDCLSVVVGNAIVRALREVASKRPELFPSYVRAARRQP
jgi:hypothetical protein